MPYTRLTIVGARRRADVVLPDDEPVGALVPEMLDLLGERLPGGSRIALATLAGDQLDLDATLDAQGVGNGALVRVTTRDDAPKAPEVVEVTEAVAEAGSARRDRWTRVATGTALAFAGGGGALLASLATLDAGVEPAAIAAAVVVLLLLALVAARRGIHGLAAAAAAATLGAALPASLALAAPLDVPVAGAWMAWVATAWVVVLVVVGIGLGSAGARLGGTVGAIAGAVVLVALALDAPASVVAVVVAAVGVAIVGVLPGLALWASGLAAHDDRVIAGGRLARGDVAHAIDEAFAALGWTVAAAAVPVAAATTWLALTGSPWALGLAGAVAVVLATRARLQPLVVPRAVLLAAAAAPVSAWLLLGDGLAQPWRAVVACGIVAIVLALSAVTPSALASARSRRAIDVVELLVVLTIVPLALGALGIYDDLLAVFA